MPSVLVETGFLTNKNEGSYLNSKKGQQEMGKAIASAILKYKNGVDSSTIDLEPSIETEKTVIPAIADNSEKTEEVKKEREVNMPKAEEKKVTNAPKIEKSAEPVANSSDNSPSTTAMAAAANITFKIQLMASSKQVPLKGDNFNGLNDLSREPYKNMYRYMYGNTQSYFKAKLLKENADLKGYTTSYIVAYKDGQRVPLAEALKYVGEQ